MASGIRSVVRSSAVLSAPLALLDLPRRRAGLLRRDRGSRPSTRRSACPRPWARFPRSSLRAPSNMVIPRRRQSQRPRIQPMESCSHDWRRTSLLVTLAPKMLRSASPREVQPPPRDRSLEPKAGAGRLVPRQAGRRPFGLPPETTGAVRGGDRSAEPFGIDIRRPLRRLQFHSVRLVIARCSVDYTGRLTARLASAVRLLIVKADGSVLVHSDGGSYKPLNWMSPPCRLEEHPGGWRVVKAGEELRISIEEILHDTTHQLGMDPGLVK